MIARGRLSSRKAKFSHAIAHTACMTWYHSGPLVCLGFVSRKRVGERNSRALEKNQELDVYEEGTMPQWTVKIYLYLYLYLALHFPFASSQSPLNPSIRGLLLRGPVSSCELGRN
jgi:hypothetical protein